MPLLLVAMPLAPSSYLLVANSSDALVTSSDAPAPSSFLLGANSSFL